MPNKMSKRCPLVFPAYTVDRRMRMSLLDYIRDFEKLNGLLPTDYANVERLQGRAMRESTNGQA